MEFFCIRLPSCPGPWSDIHNAESHPEWHVRLPEPENAQRTLFSLVATTKSCFRSEIFHRKVLDKHEQNAKRDSTHTDLPQAVHHTEEWEQVLVFGYEHVLLARGTNCRKPSLECTGEWQLWRAKMGCQQPATILDRTVGFVPSRILRQRKKLCHVTGSLGSKIDGKKRTVSSGF